jgi:crotonobetainyl-CoA:carnitine CoA-transferase CaiB-like acyl-CoA transferase
LISFTGSTQAMVERLFRAMGMPGLIDDDRFATNADRVRHRRELDGLIGDWMAQRTLAEIQAVFDEHEVAASPILNIADIFEEAHYWERGALVEVEDPDLGPVRLQGIAPKFSRTPGAIKWLGRGVDADRDDILCDWIGSTGPSARRPSPRATRGASDESYPPIA